MIAGVVNHSLEATLDLTVRGPAGHEERLDFVVDTGVPAILRDAVTGHPYPGRVVLVRYRP